MHLESFYVEPEHVKGDELFLTGDEMHHLVRVVRKKKGDLFWAVDGQGSAYQASIESIENNRVCGRIMISRRRLGEPVAEITLAQGILKGDRFDLLVEKTTEIGIRKIIPFISTNSDSSAGSQKTARWKRVAMSAMKQSGRSILPEITEPVSLDRVLVMGSNYHIRIIAHPVNTGFQSCISNKENVSLSTQKVLVVVGPAGGFSDDEIEQAQEQGFIPVGLGSRRLRSETAAIVLSTLILNKLGELG